MKRIIFVGGGHAHLYCIAHSHPLTSQHEVILISPNRYQYYSGMFSSFTEGIYDEEEIRIDLEKLSRKRNVSFLKGEVVKVDQHRKRLTLNDGTDITYDIVSFDIGSKVKRIGSDGLHIKPNYIFTESIKQFRKSAKPVIIGGGASGIELALSVVFWRKKNGLDPHVTLISSSPILNMFHSKAAKKARKIINNNELNLYENEQVEKIKNDKLMTNKGREISFTHLLPLTGAKADDLFTQSNLPTNDGYLRVHNTLQCIDHSAIFGAGDCIHFSENGLPKNGVYAVRQGPILIENIQRYLERKPLIPFQPQKKYLAILSLGEKKGLFIYSSRSWIGKSAWYMKHYIDTQFIKKYKRISGD